MTKITREEIDTHFEKIDRQHETALVENGYPYIPLSHIIEPLTKLVALQGFEGFKHVADGYEEGDYCNFGDVYKVFQLTYKFPSQKEGFQILYRFSFHAFLEKGRYQHIEGFEYTIKLQKQEKEDITIAGNTERQADLVRKTVETLKERVWIANDFKKIEGDYPLTYSYQSSPHIEKKKERIVTEKDTRHILFYDTAYKPWMKEVETHITSIKERIEKEIEHTRNDIANNEKEMLDIENEYLLDN